MELLSAIIEMADLREQRACIKFCFKLGKTVTECYEMLKTAFGEQAMGRSQILQWFSRFKAGRTSTDMDLQEVGGGGDWIELAPDRDRWRALVNTVMNFRVP